MASSRRQLLAIVLYYFVLIINLTVGQVRDDLFQAVFIADVDTVRTLINRDPNVISSRPPILVNRVDKEHGRSSAMVCGLDPQHENKTLLDLECATITELLHKSGANMTMVDKFGWDALSIAASRGFNRVCHYLLNAAKVPVDSVDKDNRTSLMKASANGHLEVVDELLVGGANPFLRDKNGQTFIHFAVLLSMAQVNESGTMQEHMFLPFFTSLVDILQQRNISLDIADADGRTALMYASIRGDAEVVRLLLAADADPRLRDRYDVWVPNMAKTPSLREELLEAVARRIEQEHSEWMSQSSESVTID